MSWATLGSSSSDNNCFTAMRILPLATFAFFVLNFYESGAEYTLCEIIEDDEDVLKPFNVFGHLRSAEKPTIPIIQCNLTTSLDPPGCSLCNQTEMVSCIGAITYLPKPSDLPERVQRYDVSSSFIKVISGDVFQDKEINEIHIQHNKLMLIGPGAFDRVQKLKFLTLANNELATIRVDMFAKLKDLEILILDNNNFEVTNSGDFVSASDGDLSDGSSRPFKIIQMHSLHILSLAKNPLKQFPKQSLRWLKGSKLEILSLRGSQLESVHKGELGIKSTSA